MIIVLRFPYMAPIQDLEHEEPPFLMHYEGISNGYTIGISKSCDNSRILKVYH